MAGYFGASSGSDQLSFLSMFHPKTRIQNLTSIEPRLLDIHLFNSMTKTFKPEADLFYFLQLIDDAKSPSYILDLEQQSILAFSILFDHDVTTTLVDSTALFGINLENIAMIQSCTRNSGFNSQDFKSTLLKMAVFCSYNIFWGEADGWTENVTTHIFDIKYTQNEEFWLLAKVREVEDAFKSVPIPSDILEEFTMVNLGVPLSKHYFAETTALGMERAWKIFLTQPECSSLPVSIQTEIKSSRVASTVAMVYARTESFDAGIEQLQFACGEEDEIHWRERFHQTFGRNELQKVGFFQSSHDLPEFQVGEEFNSVLSFMTEASALAKDRILWGIMMLLVVTKPLEESSSAHPLSVINSQYQFVMGRRLRWLFSDPKNRSNFSFSDPHNLICKVMTLLSNIDGIANRLQSVVTLMTE